MDRRAEGSFVIAPGGTPHDFENRSAARAGVLNFSVPGDFEPQHAGRRGVVSRKSARECGVIGDCDE